VSHSRVGCRSLCFGMRNRVSATPASLDRVQVAVTAPHLAAALSALAAKILQTRASVRFGLRVRVMAIRHTFNGKLEFNSHIRQDAQLLLRLMLENRFPRIWVPDAENRDLRQLLWHRHRLVQMRTRVMNQLHVVPLNEGLRRKKALWRPAGRKELESIALAPWASRRRQDLLDLLDQLTPKIQELTRALEEEVEKRPVTRLLMTHPGVGPLTALAYELVIGTPERFHCGKQLASYVGLVPEEKSSGDRRRLGHISKQGNVLLRFLLVEAAQVTVRSQQEWRSKFFHLAMRRGRKIAKVAMARKLAVHLYWMWRQGCDYGQTQKLGSHAGEPGNRDGER